VSSPTPRLADVIRAWVGSAQDDRRAIDVLQTAAGLLKALLISYGVEPEDSHVIGNLVAKLHRLDRETSQTIGPVDRLTTYAVAMRYPPRPGHTPRSLSEAQMQADIAVAVAACDLLGQAIQQRLASLDADARRQRQAEPPTR